MSVVDASGRSCTRPRQHREQEREATEGANLAPGETTAIGPSRRLCMLVNERGLIVMDGRLRKTTAPSE